jgi:hypothetical protein
VHTDMDTHTEIHTCLRTQKDTDRYPALNVHRRAWTARGEAGKGRWKMIARTSSNYTQAPADDVRVAMRTGRTCHRQVVKCTRVDGESSCGIPIYVLPVRWARTRTSMFLRVCVCVCVSFEPAPVPGALCGRLPPGSARRLQASLAAAGPERAAGCVRARGSEGQASAQPVIVRAFVHERVCVCVCVCVCARVRDSSRARARPSQHSTRVSSV